MCISTSDRLESKNGIYIYIFGSCHSCTKKLEKGRIQKNCKFFG